MDKESRRKNGKDVRTITGFTSKNNEKVDGIKKVNPYIDFHHFEQIDVWPFYSFIF